MNKYKVTLVAFVGLFSSVYFLMCPQIAFLRRPLVTLDTFLSDPCENAEVNWVSHIIFLLGPQQNNMIVSTVANRQMQITYHYFSVFLIVVSPIWDVWC